MLLLQPVALLVALVPVVMMAGRGRWPTGAVVAWLLSSVLVLGYFAALVLDIDRADATGGAGDPWAGSLCFAGACAAALVSVLVIRAHGRRPRS